jgi:hypothetical protein
MAFKSSEPFVFAPKVNSFFLTISSS